MSIFFGLDHSQCFSVSSFELCLSVGISYTYHTLHLPDFVLRLMVTKFWRSTGIRKQVSETWVSDFVTQPQIFNYFTFCIGNDKLWTFLRTPTLS